MNHNERMSLIQRYDSNIANVVSTAEVEEYAIEWLADAINQGIEVEFGAVCFSIEHDMPYFCYTEGETFQYGNAEDPFLFNVEAIYSLLLVYGFGGTRDDRKALFWMNVLFGLAKDGDYMAQAALCWRIDSFLSDVNQTSDISDWLDAEELVKVQKIYGRNLARARYDCVPAALLAYAVFNRELGDEEREEYYQTAIQNKLTDACFYYERFLKYTKFKENGYKAYHVPEHGTLEWMDYMKNTLKLYKLGAEFDNGTLAGYCQYRTADAYMCGDLGVFGSSTKKAMKFFRMAYENGYKQAERYVK